MLSIAFQQQNDIITNVPSHSELDVILADSNRLLLFPATSLSGMLKFKNHGLNFRDTIRGRVIES